MTGGHTLCYAILGAVDVKVKRNSYFRPANIGSDNRIDANAALNVNENIDFIGELGRCHFGADNVDGSKTRGCLTWARSRPLAITAQPTHERG